MVSFGFFGGGFGGAALVFGPLTLLQFFFRRAQPQSGWLVMDLPHLRYLV